MTNRCLNQERFELMHITCTMDTMPELQAVLICTYVMYHFFIDRYAISLDSPSTQLIVEV